MRSDDIHQLPVSWRPSKKYPAGGLFAVFDEAPRRRLLMALANWQFEPELVSGRDSTQFLACGVMTCQGKMIAGGYRGVVDAILISPGGGASIYRSARWFPGDSVMPCGCEIEVRTVLGADCATPITKTWIDLTSDATERLEEDDDE